MKKIIYRKLNAFSTGKSYGNPAACIYLDKDNTLTGSQMQNIAKEHKGFVSEVIYCWPLDNNLYRLCYYSSECEVEFCGHGTIACMYDLIKNNKKLKNSKEITIRTNKGELKVYNELEALDAVFITAPEPEYLETSIPIADINNYLGIKESVVNNKLPVMSIDAGLKTLIIPIENLFHIINIQPDESELKKFCFKNNIDIILVFTMDVANGNNKARTRVFAPKFGYLEDPATGSGNSAFGYYMIKHGLWNGDPISIEQNAETDNFNIVKLNKAGNNILFGGNAILKIEGNYFI